MSPSNGQDNAFDRDLLEKLACPACRGSLSLEAAELICAVCGRKYPIVEGIPVLIPERAGGARNCPGANGVAFDRIR